MARGSRSRRTCRAVLVRACSWDLGRAVAIRGWNNNQLPDVVAGSDSERLAPRTSESVGWRRPCKYRNQVSGYAAGRDWRVVWWSSRSLSSGGDSVRRGGVYGRFVGNVHTEKEGGLNAGAVQVRV